LDPALTGFESHGEHVTLRFTDGHEETADIVVAADGIRSAIRETLFHPAPPVFAGFVAWRGLVDTSELPRHLHESAVAFGHGRHINRYLVRRGELLNFIAVAHRDKWEAEGWNIPAPLDEFWRNFPASTKALGPSYRSPFSGRFSNGGFSAVRGSSNGRPAGSYYWATRLIRCCHFWGRALPTRWRTR
jgi:2-polyprenyl-6-methoxyphenol hydroxylase-like FAD-dependent oxidoreductase